VSKISQVLLQRLKATRTELTALDIEIQQVEHELDKLRALRKLFTEASEEVPFVKAASVPTTNGSAMVPQPHVELNGQVLNSGHPKPLEVPQLKIEIPPPKEYIPNPDHSKKPSQKAALCMQTLYTKGPMTGEEMATMYGWRDARTTSGVMGQYTHLFKRDHVNGKWSLTEEGQALAQTSEVVLPALPSATT
jgi:hypothetical protein